LERRGTSKAEAYRDEFLSAFGRAWSAVYYAQPEIVRADKLRCLRRKMDQMLAAGAGQIASLTDKLLAGEDPALAFDWRGSSALQGASHVSVVKALTTYLQDAVTDGKDELETAERVLRYEVMRGARWPNTSNDGVSVLLGIYRTAAWAELLETVTEGWS
jgi:hypothetical protein